ncbi:MAG: hypothetical protein HY646_10540 [Acidobacteria bacterium]|nr:hypothetical protein [Acidobacteriota bacterium]
MRNRNKSGKPRATDTLLSALEGLDYRIPCADFLLYEVDRLIEEDRASLEDEEFRRVIDEGIHEYVDTRLEVRAAVALRLRRALPKMDDNTQGAARRVLHAVEDTEFPLRDVGVIIRTFTGYMFRRLEECATIESTSEDEARSLIERWQRGEILREELTKQLKAMGPGSVAPVADLLFDSLHDRVAAETALEILGSIRSAVSARILAHAVSEPMLDEELEVKAYAFIRAMWPLPRHYVLYGLRPHMHEDLPFRWFQLLMDSDDLEAVDRILEEVVVHADNPDYREDLIAVLELLRISRDPDTEQKVLELINTPETPRAVAQLLEGFIKTYRAPAVAGAREAWIRPARLRAVNKKYLSAAKAFDAGRKSEAARKLDELLKEEPEYPLAVMLKRLVNVG